MNRDYINCGDLPLGFGMALSKNQAAMEKFSVMPPENRNRIINGCHAVSSKEEMEKYVESIAPQFK